MYNPKNILEGKLGKPKVLTEDDIRSIYESMDLCMPLEHLVSYISYSKRRRSISFDEIYLLDSLYATRGKDAIRTLQTNDSFLGESYADIMKKRDALHSSLAPVTLEELLTIPNAFIDKYTSAPTDTRCSTLPSRLERFCEGCQSSQRSNSFFIDKSNTYGTYDKIQRENAATLESAIMISLLPKEKCESYEYEDEAIKTLSLLENSGLIKNPFVIGKRGILGEIIRLDRGGIINALSYPTNPACRTLASTLSAFSGYGAFLASKKNLKQIKSVIDDSKLVAIECATLNMSDNITVCSGKNIIAELDTFYLKAINAYTLHDVALTSESRGASGVTKASVNGKDSLIIKEKLGIHRDRDVAVSYAVCDVGDDSYTGGVTATLLPILELVAAGVERQNIVISKKLELEENYSVSGAVSTLISSARAQIELCVVGEGDSIDHNAEKGKLHVFASGKTSSSVKAPSDHFTAEGNGIYILSPTRRDSVAPDFENTRKLLDYLTAIIKGGIVRSARVFYNTPLSDAVKSMCYGNISANTRELDNLICPPVYILVEARDGIGGTNIGYTVENYFSDNCKNTDWIRDERSNIHAENPNMLFVNFSEKNPNLQKATKIFTRRGVKVRYVKANLEPKCLEFLAGEIPNTHIVLFCGNDELIASALCDISIQSALAKYRDEGKLIIGYGEGAISALSDFHYLPATSMPTLRVDDYKMELYSKNMPTPFANKKIAYTATASSTPTLIEGDCENALICANVDGKIFSDGIVSADGLAIGIYSLLCDEIVESAIKYYN